MKGIILAAGKGTRMYPMTKPVCKPLLPVYDKPLIYYPLSLLIQSGISDILVIIPPGEEGAFYSLLGDGRNCGIKISYAVQPVARGIADALLIGKNFIGDDKVCLVLGDNILYDETIEEKLKTAAEFATGATVFGYYVDDPTPFGVIEFDKDGRALSIEEKPKNPKSNYIVPGIYFYDNQVISIAEGIKPSARGELEITDVNMQYLRQGQLNVIPLNCNDSIWLDAGSADGVLIAALTIRNLQRQSGKYVGCIEECAYKERWMTSEQLHTIGKTMKNTQYGKYLMSIKD